MDELKSYYVTFGLGSLLRGYYQEIRALDREIVVAYMRKSKLPWVEVYERVPNEGKPLRDRAEELFYMKAEHV